MFCTFVKTVLLKIVQNSRGSTCARVSLLIKLQAEAQVFPCEFCKVYKNTFSYRTPLKAASSLICSALKYHYYFCTPGIPYIASVLTFRHFFHSIRLWRVLSLIMKFLTQPFKRTIICNCWWKTKTANKIKTQKSS